MRFMDFILSLIALTIALSATSAQKAHAGKEFNIFDIRKSLPLSDEEESYHDFYINMGTEDGVKVGNKLLVYRKVPVLDIYRNKAQADLIAPVAQIRVIHAQASLSIARILKLVNPKKSPSLQWEAVMVGDRVEFIANETSSFKDEKEESKDAEATSPKKDSAQSDKKDTEARNEEETKDIFKAAQAN